MILNDTNEFHSAWFHAHEFETWIYKMSLATILFLSSNQIKSNSFYFERTYTLYTKLNANSGRQ